VVHEGNQSSSIQEVQRIKDIIAELTSGDVMFTNNKGETGALTLLDIIVIAHYNSQVALLKTHLPGEVLIGTVDKFQGQEAPVVIFSMTTSALEDAPRGMEFLYSPNRLHVAVSRAKAACILVASAAFLMLIVKVRDR
jgi:superfamily I DNA and/or RNA helicase